MPRSILAKATSDRVGNRERNCSRISVLYVQPSSERIAFPDSLALRFKGSLVAIELKGRIGLSRIASKVSWVWLQKIQKHARLFSPSNKASLASWILLHTCRAVGHRVGVARQEFLHLNRPARVTCRKLHEPQGAAGILPGEETGRGPADETSVRYRAHHELAKSAGFIPQERSPRKSTPANIQALSPSSRPAD